MHRLFDEPVPLPIAAILTHVRFAPVGHLEDPPPPPRRAGLVTETGEQPRAVLVLPADTAARVPLALPDAPRVVLRMQPLQVGSVLELAVFTDNGPRHVIGRLEPSESIASEARYDLTPWAGQPVLLEFWAQRAGALTGVTRGPDGVDHPADETRLAGAHIFVPEEWAPAPSAVDSLARGGRLEGTSSATEPAAEPSASPAPAQASLQGGPPAGSKPSFLVITLDALARAAATATVDGAPVMPNLAALVARGVAFEGATAPASYTLASVASLLTGQGPLTHGVALIKDDAGRIQRLRPDAPSLAATLREHGWRTGAFMTNPNTSAEHGFDNGFERYEELFHDPYKWDEGVAGEHLEAPLEAFLKESAGEPFLAWVHVFEPHAPYDAPADLQERFVPPYDGDVTGQRDWIDAAKLGERTADAAGWKHLRDLYTARTALADRVLGELLAVLDRSGRAKDTVIVVLSDHGEAFNEHNALEHGDNVYHEQVDVPLAFVGTAAKAGSRPGPASLIDVAPTLLALAGVPAPAGMQGMDLLAGPLDPQRPLLSRDAARVPMLAWTRGSLRLIVDLATRRRGLYDLQRDPAEQANLIETRPVTGMLMYRELCHAVCTAEEDAAAPEAGAPVDPQLDEKLKQLGYTGGDTSSPLGITAPLPLCGMLRSDLTRL
jgi:arylsulfatase A-like enzyme